MFSRFYSSIKRYYVFSHSTLENQQQRVYLGSYFKILAERAEFSRLSYFFEASICSSGEHSKRRHAVIALVYTTIPVSGTCSHKGRVASARKPDRFFSSHIVVLIATFILYRRYYFCHFARSVCVRNNSGDTANGDDATVGTAVYRCLAPRHVRHTLSAFCAHTSYYLR